MNANACDVVYTPVSPTVISADVFMFFRVMLYRYVDAEFELRLWCRYVLYLMWG